ncbi:MAG TPA: DUF2585 family protein [Vicinamibacterales bacterium]|nr:DUF2585 family protein [Vicinamibacterales bacterium]
MKLRFRALFPGVLAVVLVTVAVEWWMGRLWFGPDGRFGWLETDIWSSSQSQRVFDPYSFSHILHGLLFYALLWLVARRSSINTRLLGAVMLEGAWEILENSPIIIDRYRAVTIAQGYIGDSILNSVSDIIMAGLGFVIAWRLTLRQSLAFVVLTELVMLALIRDNLTLNILMLIWPLESVRAWQMVGH